MIKKILTLGFLIAIMSILLCGCVYDNMSVNVNADGSGKVVEEVGFSKEILNKLGQTPKDFFGKDSEYHVIKSNGKEYLGSTFEDAFISPDTMNWSGVASASSEMGPVDLIPTNGGFVLNIKLHEEFNSNMKVIHTLPDVKNITRNSLEGMTLYDLIAQDVDGLVLNLTFNMPYNVKQISGGNNGVTVRGKTITFDYIKMIKSGDHEWTFESLKAVKQNIFYDIAANAYYTDAVSWAIEKGITNGTSVTTFSPKKVCTTGEILTFLWKTQNSPASAISNPFSDVAEGSYYYKAALWAYEKGLVSASTFGANVPCTRSMTVTYLWKLAGSPAAGENSFTDVPDGADYTDAVAWAVSKGITSGTGNNTFSPNITCTRGQIVTFLYRDFAK